MRTRLKTWKRSTSVGRAVAGVLVLRSRRLRRPLRRTKPTVQDSKPTRRAGHLACGRRGGMAGSKIKKHACPALPAAIGMPSGGTGNIAPRTATTHRDAPR